MTKTAKITDCKFEKEWKTPQGATLYPHELTLDNGDKGKIYYKSQNPDELAAGAIITYEITDKGKITLIKKTEMTNTNNFKAYNKFEPVGFAFSYAKDIIVAKINNKENIENIVEELVSIAEPLAYKMHEIEKRFKSE